MTGRRSYSGDEQVAPQTEGSYSARTMQTPDSNTTERTHVDETMVSQESSFTNGIYPHNYLFFTMSDIGLGHFIF